MVWYTSTEPRDSPKRGKIMITFLVVLKSGGDFVPENAISLAHQVKKHLTYPHRFLCLTDMDFESDLLDTLPLLHGWPGWWSMVEMFRITGPVVATGLDTIIIDNIDGLAEIALVTQHDQFYMCRPQPKARKHGEILCSGMMVWNGDWRRLYERFIPEVHIPKFKKEQRYTADFLMNDIGTEVLIFQDRFQGFYSYKNDCQKEKPADAKIIGFHGNPRPHACRTKWVKDAYNEFYQYYHWMDSLVEKEANHAERN